MADITSTSVPIGNSIELDELILAIANQDQKLMHEWQYFEGCLMCDCLKDNLV